MNGWKLVPVEPTEEMLIAGGRDGDRCFACGYGSGGTDPTDTYKSMLEAAPLAPSVGGEVEVQRYSESCGEGDGVYPDKNGELCDFKHVTALSQQLAAVTAERDQLRARAAELEPKTAEEVYKSEEPLWQVLNAVTDILNRRAAPHAWESAAHSAGATVIINRREAMIEALTKQVTKDAE